ncbi:hypothetical protein L228DRAFT_249395 [Xylona heveae TC161]|uniref:Histone chaperone domain-containing protein n=1 Tax=Xylona heveae (strain CBS 132557 / TC161) TaxID=1328760 RepID=A0A165AK90_XYLHT|nr:hypothetical protein L228DRAFT_249395 [Xylona heveae TC161]KZF20620.1 hypothetical protein L228DRAFT_249395 [Xylona heveae TC161]
MSDTNGTTTFKPEAQENASEAPGVNKGKGKAVDRTPQGLSEEEESSEEESGPEENGGEGAGEEEEDDDDMKEIDMDNIIEGGRRTRGKNIDFAKAAQAAGPELEEDEDDDEDFLGDDDAMQE